MNTYICEKPKITQVAALQLPLWYSVNKIHIMGS